MKEPEVVKDIMEMLGCVKTDAEKIADSIRKMERVIKEKEQR